MNFSRLVNHAEVKPAYEGKILSENISWQSWHKIAQLMDGLLLAYDMWSLISCL